MLESQIQWSLKYSVGVSNTVLESQIQFWSLNCSVGVSNTMLESHMQFWSLDYNVGVSNTVLESQIQCWGVKYSVGVSNAVSGRVSNTVSKVLKGQSHKIKVCFFWAQWTGKILLIFPRKGFSSLCKRFNV